MEFDDEIKDLLRGLSVITFMLIFSPIIIIFAIMLGLEDIYKYIRGTNG